MSMHIDKKRLIRHGLFILVLFMAAFLVYGTKIGEMGFYWDDLPNTFFEINGGVGGVVRTVATGRPAMSILYYLPYRLLGENPLIWQIYGIIARVFLTASMYGFLQTLWPEKNRDIQRIVLLLLVYPGFKQQWISKIYPQIFLVFFLEFISLIIFIRSLRTTKHRYLYAIISIFLSFYCLNASEYIFGLEFMRPVILFFEERKKANSKNYPVLFRSIFIKWIPYLLSLVVFILYRTYFANSSLYSVIRVKALLTDPTQTFYNLFNYLFKSAISSVFSTWRNAFASIYLDQFANFDYFFLLLLICFCIIFLLFQERITILVSDSNQKQENSNWSSYVLIISLSTLFLAGIPFWAADLTPALDFPNDRFYLAYMLGSTLLIYLAISLLKRMPKFQNILFIFLFCLSGFFQYQIADGFIEDWENFKDFMQQLAWRAPSLEENTFLVTEEFPFHYYSDNSLTGAINWLYASDETAIYLPYMLNYTSVRLGRSLQSLNADMPIHQKYLLYQFDGSTDAMIVLFQKSNNCLHVAIPELDHLNPDLPPILQDASAISNPGQIENNQSQRELFFLDDREIDSWCYFYQKASLAYQNHDWELVTELGDKAFQNGLHINDPSELIPFIAGYGFSGDWNRAIQLSLYATPIPNIYTPMICEVWNIIDKSTPDSFQKRYTLSIINSNLSCVIE